MARRARDSFDVARHCAMFDHLQEIEDAAARDGVDIFKIQMEILVLSLLHANRHIALAQIEEARTVSLHHARAILGSTFAADHDAKARRVAVAMLDHSFERFRIVIESPDDDDFSVGKLN